MDSKTEPAKSQEGIVVIQFSSFDVENETDNLKGAVLKVKKMKIMKLNCFYLPALLKTSIHFDQSAGKSLA